MKIIAFGDIHQNLSAIEPVRDEIASSDAVIITGDLTNFRGVTEARGVIELIRSINPNLLAQSGNLDAPEVEAWLDQQGISLSGRGHRIGDIGIFGVGGSNPSPFNTPNEKEEDEILSLLERGYRQIIDLPFSIMVPHMPPLNTKADIVHSGLHVGSTSVRSFIDRIQPDLCITGHIHESAGEDLIGKTHIINPGPLSGGGFVIIEVGDDGQLTAELRYVT